MNPCIGSAFRGALSKAVLPSTVIMVPLRLIQSPDPAGPSPSAPSVLYSPGLCTLLHSEEGGLALEGAEAQGRKERDPRILQVMITRWIEDYLVPGTTCKHCTCII